LDVGDFEIASDGGVKVAVIAERKTWGDLVGSISSNHLQEQMSRMIEKCKATGARPMLIIECDRVASWVGRSGGLGNKYIDCVLMKYSLEGVSVVRTRDVEHTRDVVMWIKKRCDAGKLPSFAPTLNVTSAAGQTYRKKDYAGSAWCNMLTAINGVSKAKAKSIELKFGSARALMKHLECTEKLGIKGIAKGTEGAISKALLG